MHIHKHFGPLFTSQYPLDLPVQSVRSPEVILHAGTGCQGIAPFVLSWEPAVPGLVVSAFGQLALDRLEFREYDPVLVGMHHAEVWLPRFGLPGVVSESHDPAIRPGQGDDGRLEFLLGYKLHIYMSINLSLSR